MAARKSTATVAPVASLPEAEVADALTLAARVESDKRAAAVKRVNSCGAFSALHPDKAAGRSLTCKRLPMHKGDCRSHLTLSGERKAASPKSTALTSKRAPKRVNRATMLAAAAKVADGTMTPSAYLSLVSRYGQRRTVKALSVNAEAPVAE